MSEELATKYIPGEVESKWYAYWLEHKLFESKPDGREPYTVVIPPPNVTGILHMGHMLNNTIQDILVRRARMEGKNACWVPGTDHASIATEAKVVAKLAAQGIKKKRPYPRRISSSCLGMERGTWRHHPQAVAKAGSIVRLVTNSLYNGRRTLPECHQRICRFIQEGIDIPRCTHGKLGPEGSHCTF